MGGVCAAGDSRRAIAKEALVTEPRAVVSNNLEDKPALKNALTRSGQTSCRPLPHSTLFKERHV